ncbi:anaerobic nitric oxide reductase flavorubredoxin [Alkalibacter mobilis]|uniref:anaerobic nitric oxide reductase flavorubredoxin n=1 Tax=Alkalibacter mobilis TaxID=2787712 RepID=UPI00189FE7C1|nr:anaerobic nitric oxide reductase flavorubredoxin [Alkalibacter mobilis]MBF7096361.1 anaerobic nitric oxide reductase flavorubredoxin [Alkalibacter mobilis]
MGRRITDKVTWVGKIDWELRRFHGDELSTHRGTSYNSYLIRDEKNILIDTAWGPYDKEFVSNLKKEIDLNDIDCIVINHGESDHSGSLVELMEQIPETPIYCSVNGKKSLKGLYHKDWNFVTVKTGDTLDIGSETLTFVEAKMLHWPDTMFTYMSGDNILFCTDAFGQHYASEKLFNDKVDQTELFEEAFKYYANILTPFNKLVSAKIKEILAMNLPLDYLCTSHGVIWRDDPVQIVEKYLEWSDNYKEDQITILYDTMWEGTRRFAEAIADGITGTDEDTTVKLYNLSKTDKNDVIAEVFRSKAVLVGSPTINKGITYATAGILEMIEGLKMTGKIGGAFGTYGWSGESVKVIAEKLEKSGFKMPVEETKALWNPDEEALENARKFGEAFANIANEQ